MEALEEVNSSKFKKLIELACSPEELKNLLNNEDMQEYIMELSSNSLIMTPTSYDFVIAHLMFDRSTASSWINIFVHLKRLLWSYSLYSLILLI